MKTKTEVYVRCQFEGFHRWENAPDEVAFLRYRHRHVFHVRAQWKVNNPDREIEFILQKRATLKTIAETQALTKMTETWSCEHWAAWLLEELKCSSVEVSEDDENGAIVHATEE